MAAPSFVAEYESTWNNSDPLSRSVTVGAGDLLVLYGGIHNGGGVLATPTGGGLTWTLLQTSNPSSSYCTAQVWWAISPTAQTFTINVAKAVTGNQLLGFNVLRFSGASGVGASTKSNASGAAPSAFLTTTAANSAIVMFNTDWNGLAGARTYRTTQPGAFSERSYYQAGAWMLSGGYYPDAGAAGSKQIGLTAPSGQKYSLVAVEVLGADDAEAHAGGSTVTASVVVSGAGSKSATGAAAATSTAVATGAGSKATAGASTATATATGVGQGVKANAGGSTTAVTAATTGAGVAGRIGGTTIIVAASSTGAGTAGRAGGSTATATATATGAGTAGVPPRDLRITNTSVPVVGWNGQPLTVGWPTTGPALAAWLTGQPTPTWATTAPSTAARTATAPATDAFSHTPPANVWTTTAPTL